MNQASPVAAFTCLEALSAVDFVLPLTQTAKSPDDPAQVLPKTRQPILVLQGDLDTQVRPANADTLAELARRRKKAGAVEVRHLLGLNHLLVPATTGEVSEYPDLPDKKIAPAAVAAIVDWLKK